MGNLPPQICIESHSIVNFCPMFYLKACLQHTEPLWKMMDGLWVHFLFIDNNRQCIPLYTKTVFWDRKLLCIAEANMSPDTINSAAPCAALVDGVSLVSILQACNWAGVSTLAGHYFVCI